jgi:hypothetical protein
MSNIDEIWASMNADSALPKKQDSLNSKLIKSKVKKKKTTTETEPVISAESQENLHQMVMKLSIGLNDSELTVRKRSLQKIFDLLNKADFQKDLSDLFQDISRPLFKCFGDTIE